MEYEYSGSRFTTQNELQRKYRLVLSVRIVCRSSMKLMYPQKACITYNRDSKSVSIILVHTHRDHSQEREPPSVNGDQTAI